MPSGQNLGMEVSGDDCIMWSMLPLDIHHIELFPTWLQLNNIYCPW